MKGQGSCAWLTRSVGQLSCTMETADGDCILEVSKRMLCNAAACRGSYPEVYIHSLAKMCLQLLPLLLSLPAKEIRLFITAAFQIKSGWFKPASLRLLLDTCQSLLSPSRKAGTAECFPAGLMLGWIYHCQKGGKGEVKWHVLYFKTHLQVKWLLRLDHLNLYQKTQ